MELFTLSGGTQMLYIDPAATSVLLTSLTAIIVAVGASAIVIWRKFKKKVDTALNKDPNANKEVEDELVILDDEAQATEAAEEKPEAADDKQETADSEQPEKQEETKKTKKVEKKSK